MLVEFHSSNSRHGKTHTSVVDVETHYSFSTCQRENLTTDEKYKTLQNLLIVILQRFVFVWLQL